ncbi:MULTISPECIES: hypothetical protein [unclassified Oceanobacter]|uniref:hypothetical protein n=1 Tax=unclassified Oceanobacter TaxID=2620260 RepID=UPI0026E2936C|nr:MULTISPECIES: hypothetical protein [unclassified Oceanobacter]MDO6681232.1 hypothetical protein [Oceanobacter sp. 5_MG-2023]MDP2546644.1 hypothetical protein [Oceanobacter sp. 4_MG-2023]
MSTDNDSRNLLDELETLQRVLDDAAGEQIDLEQALTQLNTVDDVPVLSDLFSQDEPPVLRNINPPNKRPPHLSAVKSPEADSQPRIVASDILEYLRQEMVRKNESDHSSDTLDAIFGPVEDNYPAPENLHIEPVALKPVQSDTPTHKPAAQPAAAPDPASTTSSVTSGTDTIPTLTESNIPQDAITPAPQQPESPTLEPLHFEPEPEPEAPVLPESPAADADVPEIAAKISSNPFLPQSILDRLTSERLAAQHSAEEAHRTMQRVTEQKQQRDSDAIALLGATEKKQLIESLVDELTPVIQARLREKLRNILMSKPRD